MADEFKKVFTDAEGVFRYDYYHNGELNRKGVDKDKPLLVDWLADEKNTPEEIAYVAPVVTPDTRTNEQKRKDEYLSQISPDEFQEAVFEHILEARPAKLAALQVKREQIKSDYPV